MAAYGKTILKSIPGLGLGWLMWISQSQVTPEQVGSNIATWLLWLDLDEVPVWLTRKSVDNWVFAIAGITLNCYLGFLFWKARASKSVILKATTRNDGRDGLFSGEEFISMRTAATEFYAALPRRFILERAGESLSSFDDDSAPDYAVKLLNIVATYISGNISVHGKSSMGVFKRLNTRDLRFNANLSCLTHVQHDKTPEWSYTDIAVRRDEFDAFLEEETMLSVERGNTL